MSGPAGARRPELPPSGRLVDPGGRLVAAAEPPGHALSKTFSGCCEVADARPTGQSTIDSVTGFFYVSKTF
ncbi:hypothetical protein GCM10009555_045710 [Acrocarpospora macrocephala]|uniref:Uncharacterized protein n=1 Tax=Acrocarpospora macrocephala TaxID=150177 RepID=A0A5M3WD66_9ACTN|nr:hypothetical protein Amac_003610 [Acrocarpospora macrocephala]